MGMQNNQKRPEYTPGCEQQPKHSEPRQEKTREPNRPPDHEERR